jgi:acyl carrier protein
VSLEQKISKIFANVFEVEIADVPSLEYQSVEEWDSIGHMMMISELEEEFQISIEMEDVIVISNLAECVAIIRKYTQ